MPKLLILEGCVRARVDRSSGRPRVLLDDGAFAVELDTSAAELRRVAATILAAAQELDGAPQALASGDGVAWWQYAERAGKREPNINGTQPIV